MLRSDERISRFSCNVSIAPADKAVKVNEPDKDAEKIGVIGFNRSALPSRATCRRWLSALAYSDQTMTTTPESKTMMTNQAKTMRDVVAELRQHSVGALLELFEIDVAIGEVTLNARLLSAAMREFLAEIEQVASGGAPSDRLQALAKYARSATQMADGQARALEELKGGFDAWGIVP